MGGGTGGRMDGWLFNDEPYLEKEGWPSVSPGADELF